ncbi:MAG: hypothetical protein Q8O67_24020 [Deltaproteobacteria bacterium]|nr:hypothetical protein [Deltaproteobacteria bacterium]
MRLLLLVIVMLGAGGVLAKPVGPRLACAHYPDAPMCRGAVVACTQCHVAPPDLNAYGSDVFAALEADSLVYEDDLGTALLNVEGNDSDGDGLTNLEEILLGTRPGDPASFFVAPAPPSGEPNPTFDVGNYDEAFAYRRLLIAYCARSPTFEEREAFAAAADKRALRHSTLDACLTSTYWTGEGLQRLADKRIRPLQAINIDGVIPLADYGWDYRLFVHALTGDRDARDLLLASYHIDPSGQRVEGVIAGDGDQQVGGQPVPVDKRAGMITSQWFLMVHTMFSELPRTTAAQAYRAYLGQDIARSEGLLPVEGEPKDIDNKGVDDQDTCIYCHATLDPLSYAFAHYNGIGGSGGNGAFDVGRPSWQPSEVEAVLLDVPLGDTAAAGVTEWARIAADSAQFKQNLAQMFMAHALGRAPLPDDLDDLQGLADGFDQSVESGGDNYRAVALIHRLIDTNAFGVP